MKVKIIYPVQEKDVKSFSDGRKYCVAVVQDEAGVQYELFTLENSTAWTLPAGAEIDVEIKEAPANGKRGKVRLPKTGGTGNWKPRGFVKPTDEQAKAACDYMQTLVRAVKGRFPEFDNETVARLAASIFSKIC